MLIPDNIIDSLPKGIYIKYCELDDDVKKQVLEYTALKIKEEQNNNKVTKLSINERVKASVISHINYLHNKQLTKELIDKEVAEQIVNDNSNKDYLKQITKEEVTQLIEKAEQYVKENQNKAIKKMANELKSVNRDTEYNNKVTGLIDDKELIKYYGEYFEELRQEDIINTPNHYHKGDIDIYEIMQAKMTEEEYKGFCKGNVLKYLLRADLKGKPIEDLKKLRFNTDRAIEAYEGVKYIPKHKQLLNDNDQNGAIIYAIEHLKALDEYLYMKDMHLENEDLDINYVKAIYSRIKLLTKETFKILESVVNYESE